MPRWIISSLHPAYLVRGGGIDNPGGQDGKAQDSLKPLLGADARRAIECLRPRIPRVVFKSNPQQIGRCPESGSIVSVDIEGANGRPNIVGVSWEEEVAYVFPWSDELRCWLTTLFTRYIPTFHNASYDVAELEAAGVTPPKVWWDTINMAALYDPDQPMNLQTQVLTHVLSSITWKGLVDHAKGPDFNGGTVETYRSLWTRCLSVLQMPVPVTGQDWYAFYNGLDTAWGLALAKSFQRKLTSQGRWDYYEQVMMPLQRPLLEIGARGMPVDEIRLTEHREICKSNIEAATKLLQEAGAEMMVARNEGIANDIAVFEAVRLNEIGKDKGKFSGSAELTKLKAKLKPKKVKNKRGEVRVKDPGVFDPSSNPQRCMLLYDWYKLPPIKNKDAKGHTTDGTALADLQGRLQRSTIKPKNATSMEVAQVLQAMVEVNEQGSLLNTFLQPELI